MNCFALIYVIAALIASVQCQNADVKSQNMEAKMRQMSADQMRQIVKDKMRQDDAIQANENMLGSSYGGSKSGASSQSFGIPTGINSAAAIAPSSGYGQHFSAPVPTMASNWAPAAPAPQQFASVPAPPCPRNYLFSCQPNLTPAPCSQINNTPLAASGTPFASSGAYSNYMPQYAMPPVGFGY